MTRREINTTFLAGLWNTELKEDSRTRCQSLKSNIPNILLFKIPITFSCKEEIVVPRVLLYLFHFKNAEDASYNAFGI